MFWKRHTKHRQLPWCEPDLFRSSTTNIVHLCSLFSSYTHIHSLLIVRRLLEDGSQFVHTHEPGYWWQSPLPEAFSWALFATKGTISQTHVDAAGFAMRLCSSHHYLLQMVGTIIRDYSGRQYSGRQLFWGQRRICEQFHHFVIDSLILILLQAICGLVHHILLLLLKIA